MLFFADNDAYTQWIGQAINGVRYPLNIDGLWSDEDLSAIGLLRAVDPGIPDGKNSLSFTAQLVNGVLTVVYDLEDAPVTPLELQQVACVRLSVDGFDISGLERCIGLSLAFMADVDVAWVFFDSEQSSTDYVVLPSDGVTRFTDHIEVARQGMTEISILVYRVQ
jgi:hypothetical protein